MGCGTKKELKCLIPLIARRMHSTESVAAQIAYNALSYAVWTSAATSIISRQPTLAPIQSDPNECIADM